MSALKEKTDVLLADIGNNDVSDKIFEETYKEFKNSSIKEIEGHAGFGSGDNEYDYSEFHYAGLAWRFHFCNSGRKFVDVAELVV